MKYLIGIMLGVALAALLDVRRWDSYGAIGITLRVPWHMAHAPLDASAVIYSLDERPYRAVDTPGPGREMFFDPPRAFRTCDGRPNCIEGDDQPYPMRLGRPQ